MIQFYLLRLISVIIQLFPLSIVRLFKYPFGFIYYLLSFQSTYRLVKRSKYFKKNDILIFSPLMQKIYYTQYWIETLWLNKNIVQNPEKYVEINDRGKIERLIKQNTGFIIALPHHGNWEFAIPAGIQLGLELVAVAEPLSNKRILDWFVRLRNDLGCKIIVGGSNSKTFPDIKTEILNGKSVCLVSERHISKSGTPTEFFGRIAAFPSGPIHLALETGCPIIPTTCIATPKGFTIYFGNPFYVPKFGSDAQSLQNGLKTLAKEFERLISLSPNQWHSTVPIWSDE